MLEAKSLALLEQLLATGPVRPLTDLSPSLKAAALMVLLGLALVGLVLVVSILIGGRWVRRLGGRRRGPTVPPDFFPNRGLTPPATPPAATSEGDTLSTDETISE